MALLVLTTVLPRMIPLPRLCHPQHRSRFRILSAKQRRASVQVGQRAGGR